MACDESPKSVSLKSYSNCQVENIWSLYYEVNMGIPLCQITKHFEIRHKTTIMMIYITNSKWRSQMEIPVSLYCKVIWWFAAKPQTWWFLTWVTNRQSLISNSGTKEIYNILVNVVTVTLLTIDHYDGMTSRRLHIDWLCC